MTKQEAPQQEALTIVQEKVKGMQAMLDSSPVETDEQLAAVAEKISNVKKLGKYIKGEMDKLVAPAKAIIAEAKAKYDPYINECASAERELKNRAQTYMDEQDRKRREEEAKIAARVEAGRLKPENAVKKIEAMAPVEKTVKTAAGGLTRSVRKVAVIVDPQLVPDEYWVIDEVKVKKVAEAGVEIPGVELQEKSIISSR